MDISKPLDRINKIYMIKIRCKVNGIRFKVVTSE